MTKTVLASGLAVVLSLTACTGNPPENPSATTVEWKTYQDEELRFSLEYPAVYEVNDYGNGILLRYDDYPVVAVSVLSIKEAKDRGLWAKREADGDIELAGRVGKHYAYKHYDGPFGMDTESYVVSHGDAKFFALEFRTKDEELDDVQQRIKDSVLLR